ncbi:MAG: 23S rRNA (uracil(1939)-C(5))-methyltransferase RlmD [Bacteroidales bacterium]
MARKRKPLPTFEKVEITDAGAEGKAIARVENMVVFIPFVVPGDVVDIRVVKKKKKFYEGKATAFHKYSPLRSEPRCEHFGLCGGCKWQHMSYESQLKFKQKQVADNFTRIGKFEIPPVESIIGSDRQYFYRNKMEFTFSNRKWLVAEEFDGTQEHDMNGLGFHLPGMFDRIIDLSNCYLQPEPSNSIRQAVRDFSINNGFSFYDVRNHRGFMRNLIIRTASTGQVMVIVVVAEDSPEDLKKLLDFLPEKFPEITSLFHVLNTKRNDIINDLELQLYYGKPFILEAMEGLKFKVGPLSFYQTNSHQAEKLYGVVRSFAGLQGGEVVYDLYCGTGTITNFVASKAKKVIGIEYIPSAIDDARENSELNSISNTEFFVGDIAKTLSHEFFGANGRPDVVITDPPRAGMHPKVVEQIVSAAPAKVVYVSCNPATQARDIALMEEQYRVDCIQPVDMFPQTHHVENVVLLTKKQQ